MKKFYSLSLIIVLASTLLVTGCQSPSTEVASTSDDDESIEQIKSLQSENNELKADNKKLKDEINKLKEKVKSLDMEVNEADALKVKYLKKEVESYRSFIDSYLETLSDKELEELAKSQWKYSIKIRYGALLEASEEELSKPPVEIPVDGKVELELNNFVVTLSERQPEFPILGEKYKDIFYGMQLNNYTKHLEVIGYEGEAAAASGTIVDAISYQFVEREPGSKVNIKISEELKERLGLDTTTIEITVK